MLPIKGAGDTGLQRRERRKKHLSRERDGHAADQRSGGHWAPETGETEEARLKGKRRTCCRSKERGTLVYRDGRDGRSRSQGKETDMLLIKGAGDTGLQRRERRKKQVSRERDGHAVDQRRGGHWSPETGETEEAGLKGKRVSSSLSLETVTKRPSIQGSNRPSFNEQRLIGLKRNFQTARSQGKQSGSDVANDVGDDEARERIAERISGKAKKEPDAIVSMPSHGHVGCLSIRYRDEMDGKARDIKASGGQATRNWNEYNLNPLTRINWRASLVPAAAVIPAPIAYIKVVAVKKLVVGFRDGPVGLPQGISGRYFMTPLAPYGKPKFLGSGGSMVAKLKLKGIDGRAPPGVEPAA
eukprot:gene6339-biopygen7956